MTPKDKLPALASALNGAISDSELHYKAEMMHGEVENVLVVIVEGREEFPIYLTIDESQILCITHIWQEAEVNPEKRVALLDAMLSMNIPMPLSSFSKVGSQYVLFGALSTHSPIEEIIEEIDVLSNNTLIAIEELKDYLRH